ncbi:MAG TPA: DUF599 family protein [Caulobacteraceae bacterium]|nr:DUF599 family protein [Caulobacteraceae bacterium]
MTYWDWAALGLFAVCWLFYEPVLHGLSRRTGAITRDMYVVRLAWMRTMTGREVKLLDSQLLGHAINSASFFASANLILIAAVAGALFGGGGEVLSGVEGLGIRAEGRVFDYKLALVTLCLARGLLEFIWGIRQMNYVLALIGAAPETGERSEAFARAATDVLNPALTAFSRGVRGYYFALAAAAWFYGPLALGAVTAAATLLLVWRQSRSPAARGIREARRLLDPGGDTIDPKSSFDE